MSKGRAMIAGMRAKLLIPLGVLVILSGLYVIAAGHDGAVQPSVLFVLLLVLFGIVATDIEIVVVRPLQRLLAVAQELMPGTAKERESGSRSLSMRELGTGLG